MLTEFNPGMETKPDVSLRGVRIHPEKREYTLMTWNIGYAGLRQGMDFFYDGGRRVRDSKEQTIRTLGGITDYILRTDSIDIYLVQEVDRYAKRSWYTDNFAGISHELHGFASVFAKNYDCMYVPMPLDEPMGRVVSGLACFSRFNPAMCETHYFDISFDWPKRLFFLKRCFVVLRFNLKEGKELVVINTHNSAFDSTGALRQRELEMLGDFMQNEYAKGNYVVAGGDWNSNPREFHPHTLSTGDLGTVVEPPIGTGFLPEWTFAFDSLVPSNRFLDMAYKKGVTRTTIIDFFVVSPNIEVVKVTAISDEFRYSDHQPVILTFRIK